VPPPGRRAPGEPDAAPNLGWAVLLVSVALLVWKSWHLGIDNDEQIQLTALLRQPMLEHATAPFDLYDFSHVSDDRDPTADLERGTDLVFRGAVKWCQAPFPYHVRFFRPLSSAFLALEFWMFGFHFLLYHLLQLGLFLAACSLFAVLGNGMLESAGRPPLSVPLVTGLLALNPIHQELLARICTGHYLLAALLVLSAYLTLAREDLALPARAGLVLALGALGFLAGEASLPLHAVGSAMLAARARRLNRSQRVAWMLLLVEVAAYLLWYRGRSFGAEGWGYQGETGTSLAALVGRPFDAALDLFAGVFLLDARAWKGFFDPVGRRMGWGAVGAALAFVGAAGGYLLRFPRSRAVTAWLLAAAALAALPVAVVAQNKLRVLALPSLPLQFLLVVMLRDAWRDLRESPPDGGAAPGLASVGIVAYATLRLAAHVVLTPVAMGEIAALSGVAAMRWLGGLPLTPADVPAVHLDETSLEPRRPTDVANVLIAAGATGVPYPFGPAILARSGFPPDVERWLFLSDLPPGGTRVYHASERKFRVSLSAEAVAFHFEHHGLYPLMQRCYAQGASQFHTRFADFFVYTSTTSGEPVDFDVTFAPGARPRFWSTRQGKIVSVEPPPIGQGAIF
jgi:hypothetical protein